MAIKLGNTVTDNITGFQGVAVSRTEYLHGCARVAVQPTNLHDGKPVDPQFFDELQLKENVVLPTDKDKGGPGIAPPRRAVPPSR
jgi:hypothetical protein